MNYDTSLFWLIMIQIDQYFHDAKTCNPILKLLLIKPTTLCIYIWICKNLLSSSKIPQKGVQIMDLNKRARYNIASIYNIIIFTARG